MELPAAAVELPVSVSVQTTAPDEFTAGALHVVVKPLGSPEATEIVAPAAPVCTTIPPVGVAVTKTVVVESDCTETEAGATDNCTPAAESTCKVTFCADVRPSPDALITRVALPTVAAALAVSVNVSLVVLVPDTEPVGLTDHPAVTPVGNPLIV